MSAGPIFQLRKDLEESSEAGSDANLTQSFAEQFESTNNVEHSLTSGFSNKIVFTENSKYTVEKLPAELPAGLQNSESVDGHVDTFSQNALVNNSDTLYMWDFATTQVNPPVTHVPLHEDHVLLSCVPKIVVTWPAALEDNTNDRLGNDKTTGPASEDCGICIVNRKSGLIQFYEDVSSINNLSSRISRTKCHEYKLALKDAEDVVDVVNAEPAGILVSTSRGRLLFVTLRDYMGKPCLNLKMQMVKSSFASFFSASKTKKIQSIKSGPILGKGERSVTVMTSNGDFTVWNISAVANCYKRNEFNLYDQILDSLKELYPCAHNSLTLLDSHPLSEDNMSHMILSSITDYDGACYYILSTIKLDEHTNGFMIFSTYRLNTYTMATSESAFPRLLIPLEADSTKAPMTSVYTIFKNCVVLTQVSSTLDQSYSLKRKWEDIICFREDAQIFGYGMDSKSVYLMSRNMGVLAITATQHSNPASLPEGRFIKSHIDQSVYFSNLDDTPIDFNLPPNISLEREEIEEDLLLSANEILLSKSNYVPPMLQSIERHVSLRAELYRSLLQFTKANFLNRISPGVKIKLIENFEILNAARELLLSIRDSQELADCWHKAIKLERLDEETFFKSQLDTFPKIFSTFLQEMQSSLLASASGSDSWLSCFKVVRACLLKASFQEGEEAYRFGDFRMSKFEQGTSPPWYIQHGIPLILGEVFRKLSHFKPDSESSSDQGENLLSLAKILYYSCDQASLWLENDVMQVSTSEVKSIASLYEENRLFWNQTLCAAGKTQESLQITEFYGDLASLAATLGTLPNAESADLYSQYFEKFQYAFAAEVFSNYIANGRIQDLYERFPMQKESLRQFFDRNPRYAKYGWMCKVFDNQYLMASKDLVNITAGPSKGPHSLNADQTMLSVAKLCTLANENSSDVDTLKNIQAELDVVDGQKDLASSIEQGIGIRDHYQGSALEKLFEILKTNIQNSQRLHLAGVIEMFTLIQDRSGFFKATKILSLNKDSVNYETYAFLHAMIWRRCALRDNWKDNVDETESSLFFTMRRCFNEQIFEVGTILPNLDLLKDRTALNSAYFEANYSPLNADANNLLETALQEEKEIEDLGPEFGSKLASVVAAANESSELKCVINYETNRIEDAARKY
ncbi:LAFA_0D16204g1_1 [Lachancea sp. 'fantastica']|nr:LAFA_0D16204g1_1 [Lachancea sp. 'fantastica']